MYKLILGLSFIGVMVFFWGRAEQSMMVQICGGVLVASMFGIFMAKKRHS